jgi:hypothetical protein
MRTVDNKLCKEKRKEVQNFGPGGLADVIRLSRVQELSKSNFLMVKICISYLLFAVFESHPLVIGPETRDWDIIETVDRYTAGHDVLDYAAKNWADHFREAEVTEMALLKSTVNVCDTQSKRFLTWFQVYWITVHPYSKCPQTFTNLMVGSYFRHETVVKLLLERAADVDSGADENSRTPLSYAAENGHEAVVELLLAKEGVDPDSKDNDGLTPLSWAMGNAHEVVVKLLLERDGIDPRVHAVKANVIHHHHQQQ